MASQGIQLPISLQLTNLGDIAKEIKSFANKNVLADSFGGKKIDKELTGVLRRLEEISAKSKTALTSQSDFSSIQNDVDQLELGLNRLQMATQKLTFADLKIPEDAQRQIGILEDRIRSLKSGLDTFKNSEKAKLLSNTDFTNGMNLAYSGKEQERLVAKSYDDMYRTIEKGMDKINALIQKKTTEYEAAKQALNQNNAGQIAATQWGALEYFKTATATIAKNGDKNTLQKEFGNILTFTKDEATGEQKLSDMNGQAFHEKLMQGLINQNTLTKAEADKVLERVQKAAEELQTNIADVYMRMTKDNKLFSKVMFGQEVDFSKVQQSAASYNQQASDLAAQKQELDRYKSQRTGLESMQKGFQSQASDIAAEASKIEVALQGPRQELENYKNALLQAAQASPELQAAFGSAAREVTNLTVSIQEGRDRIQQIDAAISKLQGVSNFINRYIGAAAIIRTVTRAIRTAFNNIKELDKVITNIAVVTNMTQADLWRKIGEYTEIAQQYGVGTKDVYTVSQIFYQQGLQTSQVMSLTTETLKMAKIAGMDYSQAANAMTVAIRAFNIEMSEAQQVTDTYSALAAKFAVSSAEIANAMEKTASSAANVGMSLQSTSAFMSVMIQTTRESAQNIGSALKSIISRYGEMKASPDSLINVDGEEVAFNKVDTALSSIGISIKDATGQFRDFDDVIMELAAKWNTLDNNTQRYIATIMAGNRQQSRFIALVSNYGELSRAMDVANNAENASIVQTAKTMDSLETKTNQLKNAFSQIYLDLHFEDGLKNLYTTLTNIVSVAGRLGILKGVVPTLMTLINAASAAKNLVGMGIQALGSHKGTVQAEVDANTTKAQEKVGALIQEVEKQRKMPVITDVDDSKLTNAEARLQLMQNQSLASNIISTAKGANSSLTSSEGYNALKNGIASGVLKTEEGRQSFIAEKLGVTKEGNPAVYSDLESKLAELAGVVASTTSQITTAGGEVAASNLNQAQAANQAADADRQEAQASQLATRLAEINPSKTAQEWDKAIDQARDQGNMIDSGGHAKKWLQANGISEVQDINDLKRELVSRGTTESSPQKTLDSNLEKHADTEQKATQETEQFIQQQEELKQAEAERAKAEKKAALQEAEQKAIDAKKEFNSKEVQIHKLTPIVEAEQKKYDQMLDSKGKPTVPQEVLDAQGAKLDAAQADLMAAKNARDKAAADLQGAEDAKKKAQAEVESTEKLKEAENTIEKTKTAAQEEAENRRKAAQAALDEAQAKKEEAQAAYNAVVSKTEVSEADNTAAQKALTKAMSDEKAAQAAFDKADADARGATGADGHTAAIGVNQGAINRHTGAVQADTNAISTKSSGSILSKLGGKVGEFFKSKGLMQENANGILGLTQKGSAIVNGGAQIARLIAPFIVARGASIKDSSTGEREDSKIVTGIGNGLSGAATGVSVGSMIAPLLGPFAAFGPVIGGIAGFLTNGIGAILDGLDLTVHERVELAKKEAQEASDNAMKKTAVATELENTIENFNNLRNAMYNSEEDMQAYQDAVANLAETYPGLVESMDATGNITLDLQVLEQQLADARRAAAQATIDSLKAEKGKVEQQQAAAQEFFNDIKMPTVTEEQLLASTMSTSEEWFKFYRENSATPVNPEATNEDIAISALEQLAGMVDADVVPLDFYWRTDQEQQQYAEDFFAGKIISDKELSDLIKEASDFYVSGSQTNPFTAYNSQKKTIKKDAEKLAKSLGVNVSDILGMSVEDYEKLEDKELYDAIINIKNRTQQYVDKLGNEANAIADTIDSAEVNLKISDEISKLETAGATNAKTLRKYDKVIGNAYIKSQSDRDWTVQPMSFDEANNVVSLWDQWLSQGNANNLDWYANLDFSQIANSDELGRMLTEHGMGKESILGKEYYQGILDWYDENYNDTVTLVRKHMTNLYNNNKITSAQNMNLHGLFSGENKLNTQYNSIVQSGLAGYEDLLNAGAGQAANNYLNNLTTVLETVSNLSGEYQAKAFTVLSKVNWGDKSSLREAMDALDGVEGMQDVYNALKAAYGTATYNIVTASAMLAEKATDIAKSVQDAFSNLGKGMNFSDALKAAQEIYSKLTDAQRDNISLDSLYTFDEELGQWVLTSEAIDLEIENLTSSYETEVEEVTKVAQDSKQLIKRIRVATTKGDKDFGEKLTAENRDEVERYAKWYLTKQRDLGNMKLSDEQIESYVSQFANWENMTWEEIEAQINKALGTDLQAASDLTKNTAKSYLASFDWASIASGADINPSRTQETLASLLKASGVKNPADAAAELYATLLNGNAFDINEVLNANGINIGKSGKKKIFEASAKSYSTVLTELYSNTPFDALSETTKTLLEVYGINSKNYIERIKDILPIIQSNLESYYTEGIVSLSEYNSTIASAVKQLHNSSQGGKQKALLESVTSGFTLDEFETLATTYGQKITDFIGLDGSITNKALAAVYEYDASTDSYVIKSSATIAEGLDAVNEAFGNVLDKNSFDYMQAYSDMVDERIKLNTRQQDLIKQSYDNAFGSITEWKEFNVSRLTTPQRDILTQNGAAIIEDGILTVTNAAAYAENVIQYMGGLTSLDSETLYNLTGLTSSDLAKNWRNAQEVRTQVIDTWTNIGSNFGSLTADNISTLIEKGNLDLTEVDLQQVGNTYILTLEEYKKQLLKSFNASDTSDLTPEQQAKFDEAINGAESALASKITGLDWDKVFDGTASAAELDTFRTGLITSLASLGIEFGDILTDGQVDTAKVIAAVRNSGIDEALQDQIIEHINGTLASARDAILSGITNASSLTFTGTTNTADMQKFIDEANKLGVKVDMKDFSYDTNLQQFILDGDVLQRYVDAQKEELKKLGLSKEVIEAYINDQTSRMLQTNMDVTSILDGISTPEQQQSMQNFASVVNNYLSLGNKVLRTINESESATLQSIAMSGDSEALKNYTKYLEEARTLGTEQIVEILYKGGEEAVNVLKQLKGKEVTSDEITAVYNAGMNRITAAEEALTAGAGTVLTGLAAEIARTSEGIKVINLPDGSAVITSVTSMVDVYAQLYLKMQQDSAHTTASLNAQYAKLLTAADQKNIDIKDTLSNAAGIAYDAFGELLARYGQDFETVMNDNTNWGVESDGFGNIRITDFNKFVESMNANGANWDVNSPEYAELYSQWVDSIAEVQNLPMTIVNATAEQIKGLTEIEPGKAINVSYIEKALGTDTLEQIVKKYGGTLENGLLTINKAVDIQGLVTEIANEAAANSKILPSELAEIADAVSDYLDSIVNAIKDGISGSLSFSDAASLQDWIDSLGIDVQLDFTKTADGLQLSEKSAISLYNTLKKIDPLKASLVFDDLSASLEESNQHYRDASSIANRILELHEKIDKIEKSSHPERAEQYKEELALAEEIYAVRATTDSESFNFMSGELPSGQNNPINYFQNWAQALQILRDAQKSYVKTSDGKIHKGLINYQDWYNIITELNNVAAMSGQTITLGKDIEGNALELDGSLESAAKLIEKGASAMTVDSAGQMKVSLGDIGIDFKLGASEMSNGIDAGMDAMADSQIEMLDGLIKLLETIVAMQDLGELDVEGNGIDLTDLFEVTWEYDGVRRYEKANFDKFKEEYETWRKGIIEKYEDYVAKGDKSEFADLGQSMESIKIDGRSLIEFVQMDESQFLSLDKTLQQAYTSVLTAFSEAAKSGDYDPENLKQSVLNILHEKGLTGEITLDVGDTTWVISGETVATIDWKSENTEEVVKQIMEDTGKNEEDARKYLTSSIQKFNAGTADTTEVQTVLKYNGKMIVQEDSVTIVVNGKPHKFSRSGDPNDRIEPKEQFWTNVAAAELLGFDIPDNIDYVEGQPVTYTTTKKVGETDVTVIFENGKPKYVGKSGEKYSSIESMLEGEFHKKYSWLDPKKNKEEFEAWQWAEYKIHTQVETKITDKEGNVFDPQNDPKTRENLQKTLKGLEKGGQPLKFNSEGNLDIPMENGLTLTLPHDSVVDIEGNIDKDKVLAEINKMLGLDTVLQENIAAGITAAIPDLIEKLNGIDNENISATATALSDILSSLTSLEGIDYEKIAQGLASLQLNGPEEGNPPTPDGGTGGGVQGVQPPTTATLITSIATVLESIDATPFTDIKDALDAITTDKIDAIKDAQDDIGKDKVDAIKDAADNINPGPAVQAKNAINGIQTAAATAVKNTLNNLSTNISPRTAEATLKVHVSQAKGNVALASGTPTLMGELGPELVVSQGRYFVVGQAGAEFVDLDKDAIVFNHRQTQQLLTNGGINSRGKPFTNETNAISRAKGTPDGTAKAKASYDIRWKNGTFYTDPLNIAGIEVGVGPSTSTSGGVNRTGRDSAKVKGTGPALADATSALAMLKQLRAEWQALKNLSAKDLAGKGAGGGGGGSNNNFIKTLEKWYNWLQKISQLETQITHQEKVRSKINSDNIKNGSAYYRSQKKTLDDLKEENDITKDLMVSQQKYFNERRQYLNSSKNPFSSLYQFDENGQIQYKNGMLQKFQKMFETDEYGNAKWSAKEQYDYIKNTLKIDEKYLQSDASGNKIEKDDYVAMVQAFWDKIDADKEEMQSLHDSINQYADKVLELQQKQNELLQEMQDNQMEIENAVLDAIVESRQREIDELSDLKDAYSEAATNMIQGLSDALSKEQQKYNKDQEDTDLLKMRRRLAILQRSGGSASEIASLEDQIRQKSQDAYFNEQQRQIDALQKASDTQIKQLERQIDIMTETLEYQKKYGLLWEQVAEIMEKSPQDIADFIQKNTEDMWSKSPLASSEAANDWLFKAEEWVQFREDMKKGIYDNLANSGNVSEAEKTSFQNTMKTVYGDSWTKRSDWTHKHATEKFAQYYKETGDFSEATQMAAREFIEWSNKNKTYKKQFGSAWESLSDDDIAKIKNAYVYNGEEGLEKELAKYNLWNFKEENGTYIVVPATDPKKAWTKDIAQRYANRGNDWNTFIKKYPMGPGNTKNAKEIYYDAYRKAHVTEKKTRAEAKKLAVEALLKYPWFKNATGLTAVPSYDIGGMVDSTGMALLHAREAVLTSKQADVLRNDILGKDKNSLVNLLQDFRKAYAGMGTAALNVAPNVIIENASVNMNIDHIANDYDARRAGEQALTEMMRIARKNGTANSISRR